MRVCLRRLLQQQRSSALLSRHTRHTCSFRSPAPPRPVVDAATQPDATTRHHLGLPVQQHALLPAAAGNNCCSRQATACGAVAHTTRTNCSPSSLTSPGTPQPRGFIRQQQQHHQVPAAMPVASAGGEHQRAWMSTVSAAGAASERASSAATEETAGLPAIARLQQAAQECLVGNGGQPPTPEQLQELQRLAAAVPLPELGFTSDLVEDPSKVEALLQRQEKRWTRPHPFLRGSVTYLHIHSCADYSLGIFMIPQGSAIPLHDHPGMTVISHLLFGSLAVRAFDLQPPSNPQPPPAARSPPGSSTSSPGDGSTMPSSPPSWRDHATNLSSSEDPASPAVPTQQAQAQQQQQQGQGGKAAGAGGLGWAAQVAASISSQILGLRSAGQQQQQQQQEQQQRVQGHQGTSSSQPASSGARLLQPQEQAPAEIGSKRKAGWGLAAWAGVEGEDEGEEERLLPARLVADMVVTAPCEPMTVHPEHGNIHEFVALTHCAVLDLLTPPYSDTHGRDCTYYGEVELEVAGGEEEQDDRQGGGERHGMQARGPRVGEEVLLQVVQSDFYTKSAPYMGIRVE